MSEPILLIMDFPARPPGGEERLVQLAETIAREPGLIWKIWTQAPGRAGGIYLFQDRASAEAYHAMHAARLGAQGIGPITAEYRSSNAALTPITRGPVPG